MKKFEFVKPNGTSDSHSITKSNWANIKKILSGLVLIATILPILTFFGGKDRAYVIAMEDIKRIPFIESEVKTLQEKTLTLEISQGQTNKSIEKIDRNVEIIQSDIKTLLRR